MEEPNAETNFAVGDAAIGAADPHEHEQTLELDPESLELLEGNDNYNDCHPPSQTAVLPAHEQQYQDPSDGVPVPQGQPPQQQQQQASIQVPANTQHQPPHLPSTVYGVRRGKGGIRGCIFLSWNDCSPFVTTQDKNDAMDVLIEYQSFSNLVDAAHYALALASNNNDNDNDITNNRTDAASIHDETLEPLPLLYGMNGNDATNNKRKHNEDKNENPSNIHHEYALDSETQDNNHETASAQAENSKPKPSNKNTATMRPKKKAKRQKKASQYWMQQYEEFKQYLEKHNTTNNNANNNDTTTATIPELGDIDDPKIVKFIKEQRLEYRFMKQGLETKMIPDKIDKLLALGFDFQYQTLLEEDQKRWERMLEEFKAFHGRRDGFGITGNNAQPPNEIHNNDNTNNHQTTETTGQPTNANTTTTTNKKQSPALRDWKHAQRVQFQNLQEGKRSTLTPDRIRKLNDAGFIFMPRSSSRTFTWDERIQQLEAYKQQHGHLNVPSNHDELGYFSSNIRRGYKYLQEGKKTGFTHEKAQQLAAMGFSFLVGKRKTKPVELKTWEEQYELLRQFKSEYGHTVVPQHYPGLGRWVKQMRREFKLMKEGKRSTMTPERVLKLADIGFVFDAQFRRGSKISNTDFTKVGGKKRGDLHQGG